MAKKSAKPARKQDVPIASKQFNPLFRHIGAYAVILIAAMLYFKPVAFDGKALGQHDNLQSTGLQTEFLQYQKKGETIKWTNQFFGGSPMNLIQNQSVNYTIKTWQFASLFQPYSNPWISLFVIMLFSYIALVLLGVDWVVSIVLSLVLGFFTANTLFINAGHTGKMHVLATAPLLLASLIYAYKRNILLGASIFALTLGVNLMKNHVQMTYYTFLGMLFFGAYFLYDAVQQKKLAHFAKFVAAMLVATLLGVGSNAGFLWPVYEYGQESTRGSTELKKKGHATGLDKDYVFAFSYEKGETFSLMFPNFYGATQAKSFYNQEGSTETALALRNPTVAKQLGAVAGDRAGRYLTQYRGSQRMCGGPIYYGVVAFFLFFMAILLVRGPLKWAFLSSFLLFLMLAWGRNFAFFNDLMYDYFPLYSKFRDTKMTLLVAQPFLILFIGLGLKEWMHLEAEKYKGGMTEKMLNALKQGPDKKGFVVLSGALTAAVCFMTLLYGFVGTPSAIIDADIAQIPTLVNALESDRAALIIADAVRALGFVLATFAVLYLCAKNTINMSIAAMALLLIAAVDLLSINGDYLNENNYTDKNYVEESAAYPTSKADREILAKDKGYYRVADYSRGAPSQSAAASFFHKSVGGYSAAKPQLYQELWTGFNLDNFNEAKKSLNIFNMLNVKYIILSQEQSFDIPTALGHAWFVDEIKMVEGADAELQALAGLPTQTTAVIQNKYLDYLKGLQNTSNPADRIYLKSYHPDTLSYVSETANERFAQFSEMFYPPSKGWKVYINGQEVEGAFIKTNFAIRGMRIPAGNNEIKMVFSPNSLRVGNTIGGIASMFIYILLGWSLYSYFKANKEVKS